LLFWVGFILSVSAAEGYLRLMQGRHSEIEEVSTSKDE